LRIKKPGRLPAPGHRTYSFYQYKAFTNLILAVICGLSKLQKYFLKNIPQWVDILTQWVYIIVTNKETKTFT
jgi:DMSO reductase anchor subunit